MKNFILLSLFIGLAFWYGKNEDRVNDMVMYHTLSTVDSVSRYLAENDNEVNVNHEDSIIASPDNMYKVEYIINSNGYKHPVKVTTNGKPKLVHENGVYTITYSFITGGNYSFSGDKNTTIKIISVTKVGEETKEIAHNKKEITSYNKV